MTSNTTERQIKDLLSRPIAYNRVFARIAGGATTALMLSQPWYWTQTETVRKRGGWFYKSAKEWEDETGLTRREQETARKKLKARGLIEERLRGIPATMNFRIKQERLIELLTVETTTMDKSAPADQLNPSMDETTCEITKAPDKLDQNSHTITENTQESTKQRISLDNSTKDQSMPAASIEDCHNKPNIKLGANNSVLKNISVVAKTREASAHETAAGPKLRQRPLLSDNESGPVKRIVDFYSKATGRKRVKLTDKIRKSVASRISSNELLNPYEYQRRISKWLFLVV